METKAMPFKNNLKYHFFIYVGIAFLLVSCNNDDNDSTKSNEKQLITFQFLSTNNALLSTNIVATIDETAKNITATLPIDTALNALVPSLTVSDNASYNLMGAQDFTNPVIFSITAEDNSTVDYTATITRELSEKGILQLILDANPENTLNWDVLNTKEIGVLEGVLNPQGSIIELFIPNKNLTEIPIEIGQLSNLENLYLGENKLSAIPKEIGLLSNLKVLALEENNLASIPKELGKLSALEILDLRGNNPITSIPQEVLDLQISNGGILQIFISPE